MVVPLPLPLPLPLAQAAVTFTSVVRGRDAVLSGEPIRRVLPLLLLIFSRAIWEEREEEREEEEEGEKETCV